MYLKKDLVSIWLPQKVKWPRYMKALISWSRDIITGNHALVRPSLEGLSLTSLLHQASWWLRFPCFLFQTLYASMTGLSYIICLKMKLDRLSCCKMATNSLLKLLTACYTKSTLLTIASMILWRPRPASFSSWGIQEENSTFRVKMQNRWITTWLIELWELFVSTPIGLLRSSTTSSTKSKINHT